MNPLLWKGVLGIGALLAFAPAAMSQATLPSDFTVARPSIPDRTFRITDYGAVGDGKTYDTGAIEKAIAACRNARGGTVDVPPGTFLTAPFALASNLNLHLEGGSTLLLSDNPDDFDLNKGQYESCITLKNGHDVAITGSGTIDGQGAKWWRKFVPPKNSDPFVWEWIPRRPRLIELSRCTRVLVQGITLTNSPMFHLVPAQCRDVTIDGIHILAPAFSPNTDGIDPSGINIEIQACTIDTGDDCIAVKAGNRYDPNRPSCENVLVTGCTFLHGHGMSVGSESNGGLRNMLVQNCTFDATEAGIRLKSPRGRGGLVEYLTYQNLTMTDVKNSILITSYYPRIPIHPDRDRAHEIDNRTPIWRHIRIRDVNSTGGLIAGQIVGLPEMPIEDVVLTNVRISAKHAIEIAHARGIQFVNCVLAGSIDKPMIVDATVEGLNQELPQGNSVK
ncbi:MAG: glycoside hydrolase family 28 protein [Tepidisphaeraceae bacterium]|jgi:polygalacturonase